MSGERTLGAPLGPAAAFVEGPLSCDGADAALAAGAGLPGRCEAVAPKRGTGTREGEPRLGLPGLLCGPATAVGGGRALAAWIACIGTCWI